MIYLYYKDKKFNENLLEHIVFALEFFLLYFFLNTCVLLVPLKKKNWCVNERLHVTCELHRRVHTWTLCARYLHLINVNARPSTCIIEV